MGKIKRNVIENNLQAADLDMAEGHVKKKKRLKMQVEAVTLASGPGDFDKYRSPNEAEDHWQLRRMFMEKNYQNFAEDELECLAQVFINIELLHCLYPSEIMDRVAELSGGITNEYRRQRCTMLQRTFIFASQAAASKVQKKPLILEGNVTEGTTKPSLHVSTNPFEPVSRPKKRQQVLHNIVVMNNSFEETASAFDRLKCGLKIECSVSVIQQEFSAVVKVGKYVLGTANGDCAKTAKKEAKMASLEYLSKRCFSLTRKKLPHTMDGVLVIPKTGNEQGKTSNSDVQEELAKLDVSNVGFKLMTKLGWKGGCLGVRGDGIVDPVQAEMKIGRQGLGNVKPTESDTLSRSSAESIKEQLRELRDGIVHHHLVFSAEFSKTERAAIHLLARQYKLNSRSFGTENKGNRQIVVSTPDLSPHMKLKAVLIEKDPFYCEMYEVTPPTNNI